MLDGDWARAMRSSRGPEGVWMWALVIPFGRGGAVFWARKKEICGICEGRSVLIWNGLVGRWVWGLENSVPFLSMYSHGP